MKEHIPPFNTNDNAVQHVPAEWDEGLLSNGSLFTANTLYNLVVKCILRMLQALEPEVWDHTFTFVQSSIKVIYSFHDHSKNKPLIETT